MSNHSGSRTESLFPPHVLREYALLADGERGAIVGPRGDIAWMCAPRWHCDAVFSALIGGNGCYAVTPADPRFVWGGYYEDGSLIWRSRWVTTGGIIECREALAYPADTGTAVLLRRIEAIDGPARLLVLLDVRAGFGPAQDEPPHVRPGRLDRAAVGRCTCAGPAASGPRPGRTAASSSPAA